MPLDNFGRAGPHVYRCAQFDAEGMETLISFGVTVVVKLNTREEAPEVFASGVTTLEYPFHLQAPPDAETIRLVQQIQEFVDGGETVVIHCTHGRDRTGFVVAAYQMLALGMSFEAVIDERARYGVDSPWHRLFNESFTNALERLTQR